MGAERGKRGTGGRTGKPVDKETMDAMRERLEEDMIKARLALPPNKRTGFLRRRLPNEGSAL